jgi:hypothetical protein
MLAVAAIIGFLASWRAGRRGDSRVGVAVSGATGPLLVAAAYLLAAPQFAGADNIDISQWSAAMFAPYAVLAGLAGSVLVAAIGPPLTAEEKAAKRARAAERSAAREAAREAQRRDAEEAKAVRQREDEEAKALRQREDEEAKAPKAEPVPETRSDDDLVDWPSALDDKAASKVSTAKGTAPARDPDDDLEDDAYAPARAYRGSTRASDTDAKAYASDTVEAEPTPASGAGDRPATGRAAAPRAPLWPKQQGEATASSDTDPPPDPPKTRRPRR